MTLYSTHCPKCKVIEMKLKQLQLDYTIVDDTDEVVKVGKSHDITSAPILEANDNYYDFAATVKYLNDLKERA